MCKAQLELLAAENKDVKSQVQEAKARGDEYAAQLKTFQGPAESKLYSAFKELGVELQAYHGNTGLVGNHMFKILSITNETVPN